MAKVIRYTKYGYEIYDTETMSYKMLDSSYTHVSDFIDGFAEVLSHKNGRSRYGYINENGDEVVPAIYTKVSDRYKGYVFAKKYNDEPHMYWYILNIAQGTCVECPIKQPRYDYRVDYVRCVGSGLITTEYSRESWHSIKHYKLTERGELKPFLNNTNSEITFISNYSNNRALVEEKTCENVPYGGNIGATYKSNKYSIAIIDDNGNILCRLNNKLHRYINYLIGHANYESPFYIGKLSQIHDSIYSFAIATETLRLFPREEIYINTKTDNQDCYGEYDYIDPIDHCGLRRVRRNKFGWGYINEDNTEVIACQYAKAAPFINNIAKVRTNAYPYRCNIDIKGNIVEELPPLYNLHYRQDLATFNIGNIKATIDRRLRNYCRYQNAELYISGFLAVDNFVKGVAVAVDKNNKCGIIDIGGNKLSEFIYDNIYDDGTYLKTHIGDDKDLFCSDSVWSITLNSKEQGNKYGYLSRSGNILIKCEYDYLSQIDNGVVRGYKDGKLYIINIAENKRCYYTLDNWLINIGKVVESYTMRGDIFPFLSLEEKSSIIDGVKNGKWRSYYNLLKTAVDKYICSLDLSAILDNYKINYEVDTYCRPGDKDDDCDAYLISNFEGNQDVYLSNLLSYHKVLFSASHYGAWVKFCSWQRTEECRNAHALAISLTEEKINYFKQHYSKEEHVKVLAKHIHNELKKKAIAKEIDKWIESYKDLLN